MKKHILVIDDERLMCHGLKRALSHDTIQVDTANTAADALNTLNSCNFDVCLFDVRFPDENGMQLIEAIRERWPDMKIILMTASDSILFDEIDIQQFKRMGICHFLCKPFELQQLKDVVSHVLNGGRDGQSSRSKSDYAVKAAESEWGEEKEIFFSMSVISEGEVKRRIYPAQYMNVNDIGLILITPCLLKPSQVISFDEELERKSGVVVWSSLLDEQRCKAGIRFA